MNVCIDALCQCFSCWSVAKRCGAQWVVSALPASPENVHLHGISGWFRVCCVAETSLHGQEGVAWHLWSEKPRGSVQARLVLCNKSQSLQFSKVMMLGLFWLFVRHAIQWFFFVAHEEC